MADSGTAPLPARSITGTTATALGLSGGVGVLLWGIDCIQAHELLTPDREVLLFLAALLAPLGHAIGRGILNRLNRWADGPVPNPQKETP